MFNLRHKQHRYILFTITPTKKVCTRLEYFVSELLLCCQMKFLKLYNTKSFLISQNSLHHNSQDITLNLLNFQSLLTAPNFSVVCLHGGEMRSLKLNFILVNVKKTTTLKRIILFQDFTYYLCRKHSFVLFYPNSNQVILSTNRSSAQLPYRTKLSRTKVTKFFESDKNFVWLIFCPTKFCPIR